MQVVIAGSEEDNTSLHRRIRLLVAGSITSCIFDKIIYGLSEGSIRIIVCGDICVQLRLAYLAVVIGVDDITPAVLGNEGPLVSSGLDGSLEAVGGTCAGENRQGEKAHSPAAVGIISTGNTGNALAVIGHRSDGPGHMGPVAVAVGDDIRGVGYVIVVPRLEAVPGEIGMIELKAAVNYGNDHIGIADRVLLPYGKHVHVVAVGVVETPHVAPIGVIGGLRSDSPYRFEELDALYGG